MKRDRLAKLAAIGTAAGAFSGLFGVGGGSVIVPLLVLWLGFGERVATGTSLLAIVSEVYFRNTVSVPDLAEGRRRLAAKIAQANAVPGTDFRISGVVRPSYSP